MYKTELRCPCCKEVIGNIWHGTAELAGMAESLMGHEFRTRHGAAHPECKSKPEWAKGWIPITAPEAYIVAFICIYKGNIAAVKAIAKGTQTFCESYIECGLDIPSLVPERELVNKTFRIMTEQDFIILSLELERFGGAANVNPDPNWN